MMRQAQRGSSRGGRDPPVRENGATFGNVEVGEVVVELETTS